MKEAERANFNCLKLNMQIDDVNIGNADWFIFTVHKLGMWCTGGLKSHSARHMLLLLNLSASGIHVAPAGLCWDSNLANKSLINYHKQQSDLPIALKTAENRHAQSFSAYRPVFNQIQRKGNDESTYKLNTACDDFSIF